MFLIFHFICNQTVTSETLTKKFRTEDDLLLSLVYASCNVNPSDSIVYKFMEDEFKTLVGTFPLNIFRAVTQRKKATDEIFLIIGNHLILICLDYHALLS